MVSVNTGTVRELPEASEVALDWSVGNLWGLNVRQECQRKVETHLLT